MGGRPELGLYCSLLRHFGISAEIARFGEVMTCCALLNHLKCL